jgi:hypothetical protein
MHAKVIQLIQRQADTDLRDTFQSWAKSVQCNPVGQLCPDAHDIRVLMAEFSAIESTAHKASVAVDNLYHRVERRDARLRAIEEADAIRRARRLIDDSF